MSRRHRHPALLLLLALAMPVAAADEVVPILEGAAFFHDPDAPERLETGPGLVVTEGGQSVLRTLELPAAPTNQRDARRIMIRVRVAPILREVEGLPRPSDLWTRLGRVALVLPETDRATGMPDEVELIRFVTGYGAGGTFEADVTALAPLLAGPRTIRTWVSTWSEWPAWRVDVELRWSRADVGVRRPRWVRPLFDALEITADAPRRSAFVVVPAALDAPRLRITSTGHATDGIGANEFATATHVLTVDGVEVARWRPWSEAGGAVRDRNPFAGRRDVGGREVRASDWDRSGWHPGLVVEPLIIPLPELTPGRHEVAVEILGIRPRDPATDVRGYFALSAVLVADEPWPAGGE